MNYKGSFKRLLGNSRAAMLAAIEIYNKPRFDYRDEVFVELMINSWELFLKATVSRTGQSIYYPKKRRSPYRTLSLTDAFRSASTSSLWPADVNRDAVGTNLEFLGTYRDNAVHFYNAPGFGSVIYLLAQTSITNYHDLLVSIFEEDLTSEISWQLLPLGIRTPIEPLRYLAGDRPDRSRHNVAVDEFMRTLSEAAQELEDRGVDSSRLLTIYDISLSSVKKLEQADIVAGVAARSPDGPLLVKTKIDPNRSHPFRRKEMLGRLGETSRPLTSHQFDAVAWKHSLKDEPRYCWVEDRTGLKKWSGDAFAFIQNLKDSEVDSAVKDYREFTRSRQRARRLTNDSSTVGGVSTP